MSQDKAGARGAVNAGASNVSAVTADNPAAHGKDKAKPYTAQTVKTDTTIEGSNLIMNILKFIPDTNDTKPCNVLGVRKSVCYSAGCLLELI